MVNNKNETVNIYTSLRYPDHAQLVQKAKRHGLSRRTVYRHAILHALSSEDFERRLAQVSARLHKIRGG